MTYSSAALRPVFKIGRVIGRGLEILRAWFWPLLGLCLVAFVASMILSVVRALLTASTGLPPNSPVNVTLTLLSLVITLAQFAFIWGAVTWAGFTQVDSRPATFGECLNHGLKTLFPLSALFFVSAIALCVCYVFFVIPAVIVSLIWAVTAQSMAVEGVGVFEAFSRSAALTRDNRLAIFGLNLLVGVLNLVVFGVFFLIFGGLVAAIGAQSGAGRDANVGAILAVAVVGLLVYLVGSAVVVLANACVQTSLYVELRQIRDGGPNTAEVFA